MDFYITQLIEGIATGSIYGLVGLSMMFIYRSNRAFNFAQGEMATAVAFMAAVVFQSQHPLLYFPLVFLFAFIMGVLIEVLILKLVKNRNELSTIIVTVGIYAIINSLNSWIFGFEPFPFPSPFPDGSYSIGGVFVSYQTLGVFFCALIVSAGLYILFHYTLLGAAFQAMAEDPLAAKLNGVRVGILVPIAWGISAMVAGIAAMLIAHTNFLHPNTMETVLLYALAGAVVGGLQTSFGALVGGIFIGASESLAGTVPWIGSGLKTVAVYMVIVIFLIFRPRGLFGRDEPRKI